MYFMIGAAWACASYNLLFGSVITKNSIPLWISLGVYFASQAVMLGLVEYIVSAPLTSVCAFLSGFALMHGIVATLSCIFDYAMSRPKNEARGVMALATMTASVVAIILILVGDLTYYSNRDVTYWSYILNSAIPGVGFLIAATLVHTYEAKIEK